MTANNSVKSFINLQAKINIVQVFYIGTSFYIILNIPVEVFSFYKNM